MVCVIVVCVFFVLCGCGGFVCLCGACIVRVCVLWVWCVFGLVCVMMCLWRVCDCVFRMFSVVCVM